MEHFDFIQYHVRRFCLQCIFFFEILTNNFNDWVNNRKQICLSFIKDGAALFYTTVKEKRTFERLHKYMLHKLYDYSFSFPSNVVDRETIFMYVLTDTLYRIILSCL